MLLKKSISKKIYKEISLLNSTIWLLLFLSIYLMACNQKHEAKKGYAYYCPPCRDGSCDTTAYDYSGICPVCKMPLIEKKITLKNSITDNKH